MLQQTTSICHLIQPCQWPSCVDCSMRQGEEVQKDDLLLCLLCPPGLPVSLPQAERQHRPARNETPPAPKVATVASSLRRAKVSWLVSGPARMQTSMWQLQLRLDNLENMLLRVEHVVGPHCTCEHRRLGQKAKPEVLIKAEPACASRSKAALQR